MSRMNRIAAGLAALALGGAARPAQAQMPPLLELSGQYLPASDVPSAGGLRAQVATYEASASVPIAIGRGTFLAPGVAYHVESVSYARRTAGLTPPEALHALDVSVLLARTVAERWTLSLRGGAGMASELAYLDSGALRGSGMGMISYSFGERLLVGGGALLAWGFGELHPLPVVCVDWRPLGWLRLEVSVPSFAALTTSIGDRLELGTQIDVNGYEYALRHAAARATCRPGAAGPCVDHLATSVVSASALVRVRLVSTVWLSLQAGSTLLRRYEQKDAASRTVAGGRNDLPNELLVRAGLVWRLPGT